MAMAMLGPCATPLPCRAAPMLHPEGAACPGPCCQGRMIFCAMWTLPHAAAFVLSLHWQFSALAQLQSAAGGPGRADGPSISLFRTRLPDYQITSTRS